MSVVSQEAAAQSGYTKDSAQQGYLCTAPQPGTIRLCRYYNEARKDYVVVATTISRQQVVAEGFHLEACDGYINSKQEGGDAPLLLFVHAERKDYFVTATTEGEQAARRAGYTFVRTEGYVLFPSRELTLIIPRRRGVCAREQSVNGDWAGPFRGCVRRDRTCHTWPVPLPFRTHAG